MAPLYPGHGTAVADFFSSRAKEWIGAARAAFETLGRQSDSIAIVGQSMGAAIAAILARDQPDIDSLVMIAPYLRVPLAVRVALATHPLWRRWIGPVNAQHPGSIQNPRERENSLAYGVVNGAVMSELSLVVKLGWEALPKILAPTLVIQSRNDPRVSAATATAVEKRLGAREKKLIWTASGGHVLTVDYGRERVFDETLAWISRHGGQPR